jgi:hypothetical protein
MDNPRYLTGFDISAKVDPNYDWWSRTKYLTVGNFQQTLKEKQGFIYHSELAWLEANLDETLMTVRFCRKKDIRQKPKVYQVKVPLEFTFSEDYHTRVVGLDLVNKYLSVSLSEYPLREASLRMGRESPAMDEATKIKMGTKFGISGEIRGLRNEKAIETAQRTLRVLRINCFGGLSWTSRLFSYAEVAKD